MSEELTGLQSKILDILKWFHGFCGEHGLRYYAIGGTLLGAVRHGGFIPWDDDIDVGMPRQDYKKFLALAKDNGSIYRAESLEDGNKDFPYRLCKIYDTTTTVVYNTKHRTKRGVFMDVFPLDGIGETKEKSIKNYKHIKRRLFLAAAKAYKLDKGRAFHKNAVIFAFKFIPFDWRKSIFKTQAICEKRDFDASAYVGNVLGRWHEREIVPREIFGEPRLYDFENTQIYGPQDADGYLTAIYGDYMTPPPEEKRKPGHEYISIDLETPYIEKQKGEQQQ